MGNYGCCGKSQTHTNTQTHTHVDTLQFRDKDGRSEIYVLIRLPVRHVLIIALSSREPNMEQASFTQTLAHLQREGEVAEQGS